MTEPNASCAIAVMAKAPKPGRCKTRLAPALNTEECAAMSAAFLRDITENLRKAGVPNYIAYAPFGEEHLFDGHLAEGTLLVLADGTAPAPDNVNGFGRCLLHAIFSLLGAGHSAAGVLNSDSPTLPTEILTEAARLLCLPGDRAVLGPADDGGYYFLGLKATHAHMFADISWSTADVADQTRQRAAEIGLELVELPTWYDVDDREALNRLIEALDTPAAGPQHPYPAPFTAACVQKLGLRTRLRAAA
jgi:rSAM/selenodomain-associated transferase 1